MSGTRIDVQRDEVEWKPTDWFLGAFQESGDVGQCLSRVIADLSDKKQFAEVLKQKLWDEGNRQLDCLSAIGVKAKELENTLRFRLGLLTPDREMPWFRKTTHRDFGPFRSATLMEPVFSSYKPQNLVRLKEELRCSWEDHRDGPFDSFDDGTLCLWRILLSHNKVLHDLAKLSSPFADLNFFELPDGLPANLESRALRAFLLNVRGEFGSIREVLKVCYEQLWNASQRFWKVQEKKIQTASETVEEARSTQYTERNGRGAQFEYTKDKSFKTEQRFISFQKMEALRFMGFREIPETAELKRRYYELAKKLHPDRGGNEDAFKLLSKAYQELRQPNSKL